jgi:hypothetical protein
MKKATVMTMVCLVSVWAGFANGAVISATTVDTMSPGAISGWSDVWFDKHPTLTPSLSYHWVEVADPNNGTGNTLCRNSADTFWFSYKAAAGKAFSGIDVCRAQGWAGGSVEVAYKNDGTFINFPSSGQDNLGQCGGPQGGGFNGLMDHYDFSSLTVKPQEIKVTVSCSEYWTPLISSVKLNVVPEPATIGMLVVGGLLSLRRKG